MSAILNVGFGQAPSTLIANAGVFSVSGAPTVFATTNTSVMVASAGSFSVAGQASTLGNNTGFAANRPAGLTTILDRQFNPTDASISGGVLPPASMSGTDSFNMTWINGWGPAPLIDTAANITTAVGTTIPAVPDANPTFMAVKYPAAISAGNTPFFLSLNSVGNWKKMYTANWVCMPSNFNSNGNNIKWVFCAGATSVDSSRSHVMMLSSGSSGGYRGPWFAEQGGGDGTNNCGGVANTHAGATLNLATPTLTANNTWTCVEWYMQLETTPGVTTDGILQCWIGGTLVVEFLNMQYNKATDVTGFNEFNFEPFYGGGGGAAPSTQYLCLGRMQCAVSN